MKDGEPHGLGKWKSKEYKLEVEGEWKDGELDGKAVKQLYDYLTYYEMKDGKIDGKCITRNDDTRKVDWREYKNGLSHGAYRAFYYSGSEKKSYDGMYENGKVLKTIRW